jgi:DNA-binding CsgD family transcriptional regulator
MVEVYVKSKLVENWITQIQEELNGVYFFKYHRTLDSLKNELNLVVDKKFVLIDITDSNFHLYTKEYFGNNDHIKFIGIGLDLTLKDLEFLVKSNVSAFLQFGTGSIELMKAINANENNKFYLCLTAKDRLINLIIDEFNHPLKAKNGFKSVDFPNNFNHLSREADVLDINALTEKERKVSQLLTQGLSYKEIAQLMGVTTFAINQNTKRIYKKLSVRSRSELSFRLLN